MFKRCYKCKQSKDTDLSTFSKDRTRPDGFNGSCKVCDAEYQRLNKDKINAKTAKWRHANKDKHNAAVRSWRERFPEKQQKSSASWRRKNPTYWLERRRTDLEYKLANYLRCRLKTAIKDNLKSGSFVRDLGCSIVEFKEHLEKQFKPGMSWDNWSANGWHVDHIIPLSKFNLSDRSEFLRASNYTNMQPLWAIDNLRKSNK